MDRPASRQTDRTVSSRSVTRPAPPVYPSAFEHDDTSSMFTRFPMKSTDKPTNKPTGDALRPSTAAPLSPSRTGADGHAAPPQGILLASVRERPHTSDATVTRADSRTKFVTKPLSSCDTDISGATTMRPEETNWNPRPGSRGTQITSDNTNNMQDVFSPAWESKEILKRIASKTAPDTQDSGNEAKQQDALTRGFSAQRVIEKQDLCLHKKQFQEMTLSRELWLKVQRIERFRSKQLNLARPRTHYTTPEEAKKNRGLELAKKACIQWKNYAETKEKMMKVREFVRGDVPDQLRGHAAAVQALENDRMIHPKRQQMMLQPFQWKLAEMEEEIQEHRRKLFFDGPVPDWMLPLLSTKGADHFIVPSKPKDLPNTVSGFKSSPAGCLDFKWEDELDIIRVLGLFSDLVHRCGEKVIHRPCWCRWVIETGLVNSADTFDSDEVLREPTYHQAIRHFDALSHPLGQTSGGQSDAFFAQTMTITEWEAVTLTGAILHRKPKDLDARDTFLEFLPTVEKAITALLQRGPSVKEEARLIEQDEFQRLVSVSRPPVGTSMPEWIQGLGQWRTKFFPDADQPMDTEVDLDASANLKERHAEEEYLLAMAMEPEVLHWERVFRPLFVSLFALYRDFPTAHLTGLTNHMHECGHMSYGTWMQFCLDWRLVPQLATQEDAKRTYANCVCAERDYCDPLHVTTKPNMAEIETRKAEKERSAGGASRVADSPRSTSSRTSPGAKKKPASPPLPSRPQPGQLQLQKSSDKTSVMKKMAAPSGSTGAGFPIDHLWVQQAAETMTEDQRMALEVLSVLDEYLTDHFVTIKQFCSQLDVAKDGVLTVAHFLKIIEFADFNIPQNGNEGECGWQINAKDLSVILKMIEGNPDFCSLREFRRVQSLVHLERKKRGYGFFLSSSSRKIFTAPSEKEARHSDPSLTVNRPVATDKKSATQGLDEKDILFTQINSTDDEFYQPLHKSRHVFGYAAFVECVLKFALRHLTMKKSSSSLHSAAPVLAKCFWLLAYLEKRYDEMTGYTAHQTRGNAQNDSQTTTPDRQCDEGITASVPCMSRSILAHVRKAQVMKRRGRRGISPHEADDASTGGALTQQNSIEDDEASDGLRRQKARMAYIPPRDKIPRGLFAFSDTDNGAGEVCAECQATQWCGWGSGTCHQCSIVDKQPLSTSPFYALLMPRDKSQSVHDNELNAKR